MDRGMAVYLIDVVRRVSMTVAAIALATAAVASPPADPFEACEARFASSPNDYDSAYCFYEVAFQQRLWEEGARRFERLIARAPSNFWLPLAYGHVHRSRNPDRAEELYKRAARGFQAAGHAEGEIVARSNLRNFLFPKGRVKEAAAEMQRVVEIGASSDDPILKVRAWTLEATHTQDAGGDLGHAFRLLTRAEDALFPEGPYRLKRTTLISLGQVAFRMGRLDAALDIYRRLDELATKEGEALVIANARYNILNTESLKETLLPAPGARQRLLRLAERSLAAGIAAQNRETTLRTHRALAELLAADASSESAAAGHVEQCLALADMRQPHDEAICSWVQASLLRETDPAKARAAERRALDAAARANSPRTLAYSAGRRMRLSWETRPRGDAVREALDALNAVETLRALQDDVDSSAELFSTWLADYYWLSGRLLAGDNEADIDLAFSITERMRARSLLDSLQRGRTPPDAAHPAVKNRHELLESIAGVQRQLMDPALADPQRETLMSRLRDFERREREALRLVQLAFKGEPSVPAFASLETIQGTLSDDEALLSFQIGLWENYDGTFGGGSWLVAATRRQRSVYKLPDRAQLATMVPVFTGLLRREDGSEATPAVRLHRDLLSDALAELPKGITRLIVIPDGPLHHLAFEALRATRDGQPLASRVELVVAPSATLWHQWRSRGRQGSPAYALALADPRLAASLDTVAAERSAALHRGLRLGRLPHARREGRSLQRHVGADALVGEDASESALKRLDLGKYGILHFAAHAIADEAQPERSAVLLSAGSSSEDGLLQAREIEALGLKGCVVVLSACQTASGAVLNGEGVLSLARAFFEAGAHSVIGSRWPIRDTDAAVFFESFYRRLAQGMSLSTALADAKREAIDAGRPATVWAGFVLLGNGDFRPGPRPRPMVPSGIFFTAAGILAVGVALGARRLIRTRQLARRSA